MSDEVKECFISVYPELEEKTKVFHNIIDEEKIISKSSEKMKYKMHQKNVIEKQNRKTKQKNTYRESKLQVIYHFIEL